MKIYLSVIALFMLSSLCASGQNDTGVIKGKVLDTTHQQRLLYLVGPKA